MRLRPASSDRQSTTGNAHLRIHLRISYFDIESSTAAQIDGCRAHDVRLWTAVPALRIDVATRASVATMDHRFGERLTR